MQHKVSPQNEKPSQAKAALETAAPVEAQQSASYRQAKVLQLQRSVGNRATIRAIHGMAATRVSRLFSAKYYDEMIPKDKNAVIRTQIREKIVEYQNLLSEYEKRFPGKNLPAADAYFQEGLQKANPLTDRINEWLQNYRRDLMTEAQTANDQEKARLKPIIENLLKLVQMSGQANKHDDLRELHESLFLRASTSDNSLPVLTDKQMTGRQENVASGGINTLGMATYKTGPNQTMTGYTKFDQAKTSVWGERSGIEKQNANASLRSVAVFQISELMQFGVIPKTALITHKDKNGEMKTGQVMEKARGAEGQNKVPFKPVPPNLIAGNPRLQHQFNQLANSTLGRDARKQLLSNIESELVELDRDFEGMEDFKVHNGQFFGFKTSVANFNWDDPVLQRDLNTLQFFDLMVAHADRHAGNFVIDYDPHDPNQRVRGVKGIDNDDTLGKNATADRLGDPNWSKTPNLPPVVDELTALRFLQTQWNGIEKILIDHKMLRAERDAARSRFENVQLQIRNLVRAGRVASVTGNMDVATKVRLAQLVNSSSAVGEAPQINHTGVNVMQWGAATAALQTDQNSYTGFNRQRKTAALAANEPLYQPQHNTP